jgi:hypothetical protein
MPQFKLQVRMRMFKTEEGTDSTLAKLKCLCLRCGPIFSPAGATGHLKKRKRTFALQTLRVMQVYFREAFGVRKSSFAFLSALLALYRAHGKRSAAVGILTVAYHPPSGGFLLLRKI